MVLSSVWHIKPSFPLDGISRGGKGGYQGGLPGQIPVEHDICDTINASVSLNTPDRPAAQIPAAENEYNMS
jgi:hypothetical protein